MRCYFISANSDERDIMKSVFIFLFALAGAKITRHVGSKLLMISMDGFRWDYLNRDELDLHHFHEFIDKGIRAKVSSDFCGNDTKQLEQKGRYLFSVDD